MSKELVFDEMEDTTLATVQREAQAGLVRFDELDETALATVQREAQAGLVRFDKELVEV